MVQFRFGRAFEFRNDPLGEGLAKFDAPLVKRVRFRSAKSRPCQGLVGLVIAPDTDGCLYAVVGAPGPGCPFTSSVSCQESAQIWTPITRSSRGLATLQFSASEVTPQKQSLRLSKKKISVMGLVGLSPRQKRPNDVRKR